ncbi:hypothetical protein B0A48_14856 [Cryoendolithus antarcticus]|uniref:Uncharacterized protein n=1 Tax=Cryoendolithus antarcticus TaxID=1507870 RepID=A0A1V8SIM6_9PEZI|nr:hypothetical protein B0A48_14856 [Cryoendolithus antarcticus]
MDLKARIRGLAETTTPQPDETATSELALLSRLPPELRLINYDHLFAATSNEDELDRGSCFPTSPVFRTCRLLRTEARESWQLELEAAIKDIPAREFAVYRINQEAAAHLFRNGTYYSDASLVVQQEYADRCARQAMRDQNLRLLGRIRARLQFKPNSPSREKVTPGWWKSLPEWKDVDTSKRVERLKRSDMARCALGQGLRRWWTIGRLVIGSLCLFTDYFYSMTNLFPQWTHA